MWESGNPLDIPENVRAIVTMENDYRPEGIARMTDEAEKAMAKAS